MDDQCECTTCQITRLTELVAQLVDRLAIIESYHRVEVAGDVTEDGSIVWRDKGGE